MSKRDIDYFLIQEPDLEFARKLRNANRSSFFDKKYINPSEQKKWYKSYDKQDELEFYIIWYKGIKVGTFSLRYYPSYTELGNVIIAKKYREQGIFKEVLKRIREASIHLALDVIWSNDEALEAYRSLGFKPYSIRMKI